MYKLVCLFLCVALSSTAAGAPARKRTQGERSKQAKRLRQTQIVELPDDCWAEVVKHCSLIDLLHVGRVSKRLAELTREDCRLNKICLLMGAGDPFPVVNEHSICSAAHPPIPYAEVVTNWIEQELRFMRFVQSKGFLETALKYHEKWQESLASNRYAVCTYKDQPPQVREKLISQLASEGHPGAIVEKLASSSLDSQEAQAFLRHLYTMESPRREVDIGRSVDINQLQALSKISDAANFLYSRGIKLDRYDLPLRKVLEGENLEKPEIDALILTKAQEGRWSAIRALLDGMKSPSKAVEDVDTAPRLRDFLKKNGLQWCAIEYIRKNIMGGHSIKARGRFQTLLKDCSCEDMRDSIDRCSTLVWD